MSKPEPGDPLTSDCRLTLVGFGIWSAVLVDSDEIAAEVQPVLVRLALTETHGQKHAFTFGRIPHTTSTPSF